MTEDEQQTRERIVSKVKKLIDRANGTNFEAEAATSLNLARELLAKYNLSMTDVESNQYDAQKPETKMTAVSAGYYQGSLAVVIGQYCNCSSFYSSNFGTRAKRVLAFVGMPAEVEICTYTFETVAKQIDKMLRKKRKELRATRESEGKDRQNRKLSAFYTRGYADGIIQFLRESLRERIADEKCRVLVLVKNPKVSAWCEDNLRPGKKRKQQIASEAGFNAGYVDGSKVNVTVGIGSGKKRKQIG